MSTHSAARAIAAYATQPDSMSSSRSTRMIEYDIISKTTYRLKQAARLRAHNYPAFVAALHDNRKLWSVLAGDALGSGNGLPDALRASIVSLNIFVQKHSARVLSDKAPVRPLLEINLAILKGLKSGETRP